MEGIMAIDPVCGMEVEEKTAKYTSEYNGETYYFCAPGCKYMFEEEPGSYVGPNRKPFVPMSEVPEK
jgi:YHS domain-containing protein